MNELAEFQELQDFHCVESLSVKFGEITDTKTDTVKFAPFAVFRTRAREGKKDEAVAAAFHANSVGTASCGSAGYFNHTQSPRLIPLPGAILIYLTEGSGGPENVPTFDGAG